MASEVNSQVTDAVTQTNVKVVAEAPAQAMAAFYQMMASANNADQPSPVNNLLAMNGNGALFVSTQNSTQMASNDIAQAGGGQPHPNLQPYLAVNYCICLSGIFPSRN